MDINYSTPTPIIAVPNGDQSVTAIFNNYQPSGFVSSPLTFNMPEVLLNDFNINS